MKTADILTAALLRRAATATDPAAAARMRRLADETASITDFGPTLRHI